MKVREVLAGKKGRVVSVRPDKPVTQLPNLFDEHNISSVLVIDARGRLHGIVTDRLFLTAMAQRGARFSELTAVDIMQSPVPSCAPGDSVTEAMRRMTQERVRHLVVLDEGRLAGIVSIGDLVKARLTDFEMESRVLREMALVHMSAMETGAGSGPRRSEQ